jgi:hypothetical protein
MVNFKPLGKGEELGFFLEEQWPETQALPDHYSVSSLRRWPRVPILHPRPWGARSGPWTGSARRLSPRTLGSRGTSTTMS